VVLKPFGLSEEHMRMFASYPAAAALRGETMPSPHNLHWMTPSGPVLAHLRMLTDGQRPFALLDFHPESAPEPLRNRRNLWVQTRITHGFGHQSGEKITLHLPALGLTDGKGNVMPTIGFVPEHWHLLRGTTLPPLHETGRSIDFPRLPDLPIW
jgi:hypothetical protein